MNVDKTISRIMVDIETLGTTPGSVIFAIGAAEFDLRSMEIVDTFYTRIDVTDAQDNGMHIDADTVLWWMKQTPLARAEMTDPGAPRLLPALIDFSKWVDQRLGDKGEIWCKGASFDFPLLHAAMHAAKLPRMWKYWQERCFRTLAALDPIKDKTVSHRADEDAIAQAKRAIKILTAP